MTTEIRYPGKNTMRVPILLLLTGLLALPACDLDLQNPNSPTEEEVISDPEGLIALAVGMQGAYAGSFEELVQAPALVTDEWGTGTRSLTSYQALFHQPAVLDNTFGVVEEPFATAYATIKAANTLLASIETVEGVGLRTGLTALAKLYKAMSLGAIIQQYEQVPIDITVENPVPQPRSVVLGEVISLLESARTDLAGVDDDQLAGFTSRVIPDGFDIRNTVDAMLARFYLIRGDYQSAIDAAARVDLSATSTFSYTGTTRNPIYGLSVALEYVYPLESFVLEAEPGDERPAYWVDVAAAPFIGNPDSLLLPLNQYDTETDPIWVYVPDEMRLIQAEAYTRLGDFPAARALINEVRTGGAEPFANLPALPEAALDSEAELLAQIAYERRYELYMQGLRWEDTRRLDEYIATEPTLDWLPLPQQECLANPAADC